MRIGENLNKTEFQPCQSKIARGGVSTHLQPSGSSAGFPLNWIILLREIFVLLAIRPNLNELSGPQSLEMIISSSN